MYGNWKYDEFHQVGKDYADSAEAALYDESHAKFRDVEAENCRLIELLGLRPRSRVLEIGVGTGSFALQAAAIGAEVIGFDVSEAMLDQARAKAVRQNANNVAFRSGGFLELEKNVGLGEWDVVVSNLVLHHLPDFWKGEALRSIRGVLRLGGVLLLRDVVIEQAGDPVAAIDRFVEAQAAVGGDFLRADAEGHFREEFSTYDWILEGLLTRAGFVIESREFQHGLFGEYLCCAR